MVLVDVDHRRRGIGRALLTHALDYLDRRGIQTVALDSTPEGQPLYASLGFVDAFVTKLNAAGSAAVFSTYLGGSSSDYGITIFVDTAGSIYVSGESFSDNFPTVSPYNGTWSGDYDVFVARIDSAAISADLLVEMVASPDPASSGAPVTYTLTVTNNGPNPASGVRLIERMPAANLSPGAFEASQGTCTLVGGFFLELRCDLGSQDSVAAATATISVTPLAGGTISAIASVASSVSDPDGVNNAVTRDTVVTATPAPAVASILPGSGPTAGGTAVTIAGSDFQPGATVTLGGAAATGVAVTSPGAITATTSAHTAGPVDVVVTNPDGCQDRPLPHKKVSVTTGPIRIDPASPTTTTSAASTPA
jgi:uncharacterized repeat protein (TIGR01451 family)